MSSAVKRDGDNVDSSHVESSYSGKQSHDEGMQSARRVSEDMSDLLRARRARNGEPSLIMWLLLIIVAVSPVLYMLRP